MNSILIVEDDPTLLRGLSDNFGARDYCIKTAMDGETGLQLALTEPVNLILLDVMLPLLNGYEVCRTLRQEGVLTPLLMLTAKSEESDLLLGLGLGADDYVTKPFSIRVLLARCEALLRRADGESAEAPGPMAFGDFILDTEAHELLRLGKPIVLSPKEYDLLQHLLENRGRALSREQIMCAVWGYGSMVTQRSIDRFVTALRKKIGSEWITTVREVGYKFVG